MAWTFCTPSALPVECGASQTRMKNLNRRTFLRESTGLLVGGLCLAESAHNPEIEPETGTFPSFIWPSAPPAACPFPRSRSFSGVRFQGRYARYAHADTWYPSWASDNRLYSPWTDGRVGSMRSNSAGPDATTDQAVISGDDPLHLKISDVHIHKASPVPYGGRYPCGSLVHNGVWYYGTYCLADFDGDPGKGLNWDILGPFVGFRHSTDFGKTWRDCPHTPMHPLFAEPQRPGDTVRFGAPHFVDFGRDMQHSPDGKAYLVAHGSALPDPDPRPANASWITGDQIWLARVTPSPANINDASRYDFFSGHDGSGRPVWSSDFNRMRPLLDWNNHCGSVTATYIAPQKKFVMCITDGGNTISRFNTYVLEADALTGPWKLVTYMKDFGEQAYFVNIPSKFIAADGKTMWVCYAANFTNGYLHTNFATNPPGGGYGMILQEIRLVTA